MKCTAGKPIFLLDDVPSDDRLLSIRQHYDSDKSLDPRRLLHALPKGKNATASRCELIGPLMITQESQPSFDPKPRFYQMDDLDRLWASTSGRDASGDHHQNSVLTMQVLLHTWVNADPEDHTRRALFKALCSVDNKAVACSALACSQQKAGVEQGRVSLMNEKKI